MTSSGELYGEIGRIQEAARAVPYDNARTAVETLGFAAIIESLEEAHRRLAEQIRESDETASGAVYGAYLALQDTVIAPLTAIEETSASNYLADGLTRFGFSETSLNAADTQLVQRYNKMDIAAQKISEVLELLAPDNDQHKQKALAHLSTAVAQRDEGITALQNYRRPA